jgi:hypothetical protein
MDRYLQPEKVTSGYYDIFEDKRAFYQVYTQLSSCSFFSSNLYKSHPYLLLIICVSFSCLMREKIFCFSFFYLDRVWVGRKCVRADFGKLISKYTSPHIYIWAERHDVSAYISFYRLILFITFFFNFCRRSEREIECDLESETPEFGRV